jgi:glycosyltransferase involved in cell wall biosynthesis
MSEPPVCSIVIRAHNEEKHIDQLLQGIGHQSVSPVEIILVDSGSTDRTIEIATKYPVRLVHISPSQFTFGRSLNIGIAEASADLVVLASAHVYPVYPDWLKTLLRPFADDRVALTYGKQRGNDQSKFAEHQIFKQWFPDLPHPMQSHPFCNNANAAIRKSLWEENPYDELLPGLEDLDWAKRVFLQGKMIQYVPEAEIIHQHDETPRGVMNRYLREGMAFKRIFPQEKFGFGDFLRLSWANIWHDFHDARDQGILSRVWKEIIWFRVMQFWGTYRGYNQSGPLTMQLRQRFYYPNQPIAGFEAQPRDVASIQYNKKNS